MKFIGKGLILLYAEFIGVIGNLTRLELLDLSYNKLHDLTSDLDFFKLPENISTVILAGNELTELPWKNFKNLTKLKVLDLKENQLNKIAQEAVEMVIGNQDFKISYQGTLVSIRFLLTWAKNNFTDNPIHCDCLLRPLLRHLTSQLNLDPVYQQVTCSTPPYLEGKSLISLTEERLNCLFNVQTSKNMDNLVGDFKVLPDLRFREVSKKKNQLKVKWRVMKQDDIADTGAFIRNLRDPLDIVFQTTLPYFKRGLEVDLDSAIKKDTLKQESYQICIVAKTSKNALRKFYPEQCRDLDKATSGGWSFVYGHSWGLPVVTSVLVLVMNFV